MQKTRVAVLRGGPSVEYDISMQTGASVLAAIDRTTYDPIDVVIMQSGEWLVDGYVRFPEQILQGVDVVFVALHGTYGEDGTVQRLLDRLAVPYTGSGAYASALAMHKALTKDHVADLAFALAPHMLVSRSSLPALFSVTDRIADSFGPSYVIKPVALGSSVGAVMVESPAHLPELLKAALETYDEVIVEQRIIGREATCGVIERYRGQQLYALPPVEIVPPHTSDFFDYEVKYNDATEEICPARFDTEVKQHIEQAAQHIHQTLGLSQYSRSDFIVADDALYFLEVNTLPGLTPASLVPRAIDAVGGTYDGLIEHLLTDALYTAH